MRSLSPEEEDLWARVAATIRPLSRSISDRPQATDNITLNRPTLEQERSRRAQAAEPAAKAGRVPIAGRSLDGSWDRRLQSGSVVPDKVLDLHGHSLDSAWRAIDRLLESAIASGDRTLLLITGHERKGQAPVERGRIRAAVNDWLAASRHADRIAAVRNAHRRHGGAGALYIILRRKRPGSTLS